MNKNQITMAAIGGIALVAVGVVGYLAYAAWAEKAEKAEDLESAIANARRINAAAIAPKQESVDAIAANAQKLEEWRAEMLALVSAGDFAVGDIRVNIQGDEPLIEPELIDALVGRLLADQKWDMATAVTPIRRREDLDAKTVVKVVLDREDGALYFSRLPIPCDRDHEPDLGSGLYVRHLGIYAYRGAFLKRYIAEKPCALEKTEKLEQLRALWMGAKIAVIRTEDEGVGVDTPEDAVRVEALLKLKS